MKRKKLTRSRPKPKTKRKPKRKKIIRRKFKTKIKARITKKVASPNKEKYVVWKDRSGKVRKNPRADLKLIGEVRDKKSKKLVGYVNYIKKGHVIPRKFKNAYRKYIETPRVRVKPDVNEENTFSFKIKTSSYIIGEVAKHGRRAANAIYNKAIEDGFCVFNMDLYIMDSNPFIEAVNIRRGTKIKDILYIIASLIIDRMRDTEYRTSPKAVAYYPKRKLARMIEVVVKILEVEDLF